MKIKVLIADDQEDFSEPFKNWLLATREFDVETVDYGADVLNKMKEFEPDLLVLDYDLKKDAEIGDTKRADGEVIAHTMRRQHSEFNHVPFLFLTQWKGIAEAEKLSDRDCHHCIFWMAKADLEHRRLAFIANILFHWDEANIGPVGAK